MGDFGAIIRLGFWDVFEEGGDLVTEETTTSGIVDRLLDTAPDVVVLDLDVDGVVELATDIATSFPAVTIIACSSRTPSMSVFPPFHHGESYLARCEPEELMKAVRGRT